MAKLVPRWIDARPVQAMTIAQAAGGGGKLQAVCGKCLEKLARAAAGGELEATL